MKVLFIYTYNYIEPIGLMYVSSALKRAGHETFFFDLGLDTGLTSFVRRNRPDMIAYSVVTGNHGMYAQLNRDLKKSFSFFSVFGGPHATFFPKFIDEQGVDAVCRGEGEHALVELAGRLEKKESIRDVENFWIKEGAHIVTNPLRPLEESLDALDFPDRQLIYRYPAYRKRANKYVLTSRGCPFDCTYCFNHSLKKLYQGKGTFCRKRSVENVIREIELLRDIAPVKTIQFFDDVFILNKSWILDFAREYREKVGIPFICYVRVNLVDEEIIAALKYAGVVTITFAVETADDHLRNAVLKRRITDQQIRTTADLLHKYNIRFFTQNMVGLPGETIDNAFETMRLNAACRPSFSIASIFQPYPGTELTRYAVEKGFYDGSEEITHDSFYKKSILRLPHRRQFENLSWLFPIGVAFPRMETVIKLLIGLPCGYLYKIIWHVTRGYGYLFKISWISYKDIVRSILHGNFARGR